MSYDQIPKSPQHPQADIEIPYLPPVNYYDKEELDFLDLNPDLEPTQSISIIDDNDTCQIFDTTQNQPNVIPEIEDGTRNKLTEEGYTQEIIPISNRSKVLSSTQQNRFHTYLTDQLQIIQRKFIQSHGLNSQNSYQSLAELLKDLNSVIDLCIISLTNSQNFGQTNYLITIANDLLDYIEKYPIEFATAVELLTLVGNLDDIFAKLIDSKEFNGTEAVRVNGIAERTRLELLVLFEKYDVLKGCEEALGKVYERTLERTG